MKLTAGSDAPDFQTTASFGKNESCPWTLSEQLKKAPVLLVFYPRDFEAFSTRRLCDYRDGWAQLSKHQTQLVAVSSSDHDMHSTFLAAYDFPFPLLVDDSREIFRLYDMLTLGAPGSGLALVGRDRKVRTIAKKLLPFRGPSLDDVDRALRGLEYADA